MSDFDEVAYDGNAAAYSPGTGLNPLSTDTDGDGFSDGSERLAGSDPLLASSIPADGDLNNDGNIGAADILLTTQIVLGLQAATEFQMLHADVAPLIAGKPSPDGMIDVADLLLIQRKLLGLISF